jgi:hypothetical protein
VAIVNATLWPLPASKNAKLSSFFSVALDPLSLRIRWKSDQIEGSLFRGIRPGRNRLHDRSLFDWNRAYDRFKHLRGADQPWGQIEGDHTRVRSELGHE